MYEQNEAPTLRRRLWLVMWFVIIALVLWALVWLLFFRHSPSNKTLHGSNTSQNQTSNSGNHNTPKTGGTSGGSPASTSTSGSSATPSTTATPDGLANTGPGNVIAVVTSATVAGTLLYYIRLRKKLQV
jgi:cytoskeletal protein RodZ